MTTYVVDPQLVEQSHSACSAGDLAALIPAIGSIRATAPDVQLDALRSSYGTHRTLLQVACLHGHKTVVEYLLTEGCDVTAVDSGGRTALHAAAIGRHGSIVRLLCGRGADVDARASGGAYALGLIFVEDETDQIRGVARGDEAAAVAAVLESGGDVNARTADGRTAVHTCAEYAKIKGVRVRLESGASVAEVLARRSQGHAARSEC